MWTLLAFLSSDSNITLRIPIHRRGVWVPPARLTDSRNFGNRVYCSWCYLERIEELQRLKINWHSIAVIAVCRRLSGGFRSSCDSLGMVITAGGWGFHPWFYFSSLQPSQDPQSFDSPHKWMGMKSHSNFHATDRENRYIAIPLYERRRLGNAGMKVLVALWWLKFNFTKGGGKDCPFSEWWSRVNTGFFPDVSRDPLFGCNVSCWKCIWFFSRLVTFILKLLNPHTPI